MTSKTETIPTEEKLANEYIPYSRYARFRIWLNDVWFAIRTPPPKTWAREIILRPGDPGYDNPFLPIIVRRRTTYPYWPESTLTRAFGRGLDPEEIAKLGELEAGK